MDCDATAIPLSRGFAHPTTITTTDTGMRWVVVAPPGGHFSLALTAGSAGHDTGIRLTATDVEQEHRSMSDRHADVDEVLRWPGVPAMFSFRDPDGNTLYVVETAR
jgi:hypothetical protein